MTELSFSLEHLIWWVGGAACLVSLLLVPTTRGEDPGLAMLEDLDDLPVSPRGATSDGQAEALPEVMDLPDRGSPAPTAGADPDIAMLDDGDSSLDELQPWSAGNELPEVHELPETPVTAASSATSEKSTPYRARPAVEETLELEELPDVQDLPEGQGLPEVDALPEVDSLSVGASDAGLSLDLDSAPAVADERPHLRPVGSVAGDDVDDLGSEQGLDLPEVDIDDGREFPGLAAVDDLPGLDLEQDSTSAPGGLSLAAVELDDDEAAGTTDDFSDVDVETKLDLATAYVEIGDVDAASRMIAAILEEGTEEQRALAMEISSKMGG